MIIDSYHTTTLLRPQAEDHFMLQAAHVVNIYNTMNKCYSNAYVFVLVPLQLVYPQQEKESDEKTVTRLASDLHHVISNCHLSFRSVFRVVDEVVKEAYAQDKAYIKHLERAISERVSPVDVYDFAYEILNEDERKSVKIWNELYRKKKRDWRDRDLEHFANLRVYLRKWISEAFAGVIGGDKILYVWDMLFVNHWSSAVFAKITLAILFLIKPWAMEAHNHRQLSAALLEEPGKVGKLQLS